MMSGNEKGMVGFWVGASRLKKMSARLESTFAFACMHNIDYFAFAVDDINIEDKTIDGTFWEEGEFVKKTVPMPILFDVKLNDDLDRKFPDALAALKEHGAQISQRAIGSKRLNNAWLVKNGFEKFAIETESYAECDMTHFLERNDSIILKPRNGKNGEGIYKVQKTSGELVLVHYLDEKTEMNFEGFIAQNHDTFTEKEYIVQDYIESTTLDGAPMDVRLNLARGKGGKWDVSIMYTRFGSHDYVGTNMGRKQRSVNINPKNILSYQFGDSEAKRLMDELGDFAKSFPVEFQKKVKFLIPELCLDMGIDRGNGNQLKVFEVGIYPGTSNISMPAIPSMNVKFYKYLLERKANGTL